MFANYLSRKNFSHTRANRRRNASPVGLPTAPVSITSQEAACQGPLWSSSGKTCLFHEEDPGSLRHALLSAWGRSGLVALEVFLRPLSSPRLSLHSSLLPFLHFPPFPAPPSVGPNHSAENFLPLRSPAALPGSPTSLQSGAGLSYPICFVLLLLPPLKPGWFYWVGKGRSSQIPGVVFPHFSPSVFSHSYTQNILRASGWFPLLERASGLDIGLGEDSS